MAAHIINPCAAVRYSIVDGQRALHHPNVTGGQRIPEKHHKGSIVHHVAFLHFLVSEIFDNFKRLHNGFSQEYHAGTHLLRNFIHHAQQFMYIGMVHTNSSQFFPHVWYRIQTEDVNPFVGKGKHYLHNLVEYLRIFVIQIPLEFIKPGHYEFLKIRIPGKIPRSHSRKNFCHVLLIFFGDRVVIKHKIHVVIVVIAFSVFLHPKVLFCRMVQHKINTGADSLFF